jgi:hypothetical protein
MNSSRAHPGVFEVRISSDGSDLDFTISTPDGMHIWNFPYTPLHKVLGFGIKQLEKKLDRWANECLLEDPPNDP